MRLGVMHLTMAFIECIEKLFGDSGLIQILTASDVYADATVNSMLQGKQYSRGLQRIRLVHEALTQLFLSSLEMFAMNKSLPWFDDGTMQLIRNLENAFKLSLLKPALHCARKLR